MESRAVRHNFEMGLRKDYPSQIWFNLVEQFQRRRFLEIEQPEIKIDYDCHAC
jgi:hypothetical protein